jgi:hypothetical protein
MMEAASTSETSVSIYQTRGGNIPEDSHLHAAMRSLHLNHYHVGEMRVAFVTETGVLSLSGHGAAFRLLKYYDSLLKTPHRRIIANRFVYYSHFL